MVWGMNDRILDDALLRRAHDHAAAYLRLIAERHSGAEATRDELLAALRASLSEHGDDPAAVLDILAAQGERGTMGSAGPRYFGFVIGGTLPVALAADWLTSTWDQNPGIYATSPIMSVIEDVAREWLLELFDLPRTSSLGFVTGCQMANFTGLAAARHGVLRRAGWDVEADGLAGAPRIHLITGAEAHVTVDVAMRYLGFGTRALLRVETDGQGRMRADRLRRLLDNLHGPTIICAQAGNVNTGSFDPLREIAELAQEHGAWLHVDGAFGLWARASKELRPLADGIELADSWATDAHKWLNVPYDCGVVIVRHPEDHRASMTATAAYLVQTSGIERDAVDWVPEFSRRGRGVPGLRRHPRPRPLRRRGTHRPQLRQRPPDGRHPPPRPPRRRSSTTSSSTRSSSASATTTTSPAPSSPASRKKGPAGSAAPPGKASPPCASPSRTGPRTRRMWRGAGRRF